jgi:hypothetical protein
MENKNFERSEKIKNKILLKYPSVSECARKNGINEKYLNNIICRVKKGIYPSIKRLEEISEMASCNVRDFF